MCIRDRTIGAQNQLITYPAPQEAELKDDFTVKVRQPGGKWQTIATYPIKVDEVKEARHHVKLASMSSVSYTHLVSDFELPKPFPRSGCPVPTRHATH